KQELVSGVSVPNHQHQMPGRRLHIENLGHNTFPASNVEEFASTVPANVNPDLQPRPRAEFLNSNTRAHAGEVPTQELLGRHTTPRIVLAWLPVRRRRGGQKESHPVLRRIRGHYVVANSMQCDA